MKINNLNRKLYIIITTVIALLMVVLIYPMDYFQKGYVYEVPSINGIAQEDIIETINLEKEHIFQFTPKNNHLTGILIAAENVGDNCKGDIVLSVYNENNTLVETLTVQIANMQNNKYYQLFTSGKYKPDEIYTLKIKAEGYISAPTMKLLDSSYVSEETMGNNLLMGYAYSESVFSKSEKVLISLVVLSIYGLLIGAVLGKRRNLVYKTAFGVILVVILSWNYMYSTFNRTSFDVGSEQFVTGAILAEENNVPLSGYGLGRYYYVAGGGGSMFYNEQTELGYFLTDEDYKYVKGYSRSEPEIVLYQSEETVNNLYIPGHYIEFENGDIFQITEVKKDGIYAYITLNTEEKLSYHKNGNLKNITFYDTNMTQLHKGVFVPYTSSMGLQGKIFRHISRYTGFEYLNLICGGALAVVLVLICMLIYKKYNMLMAVCFYITFLLSPWLISFAKNLYWSTFLWFIPMLIGLFCSVNINSIKTRIICYAATFVSICVKCLCGYEYITSIMLGLIAFLVVDFVMALAEKNKEKTVLVFKTVFILGICALAGFALAMLIHARVMGEGNLLYGLERVYKDVALRRISFGAIESYNDQMWVSVNISVWQVICMYFNFTTNILTGIDGNLFPLLCLLPIAIFVCNAVKGKKDIESVTLYIVTFFITMSWHILAKSHSYVHPHMNFVLWYMGFVQTVIYIIAKQIKEFIQK